jgi:hypothetical protein
MSARQKMPVLTIAGVLLPAICVVAAFSLSIGNGNSGGWGLGEIAIFVFLIFAGGALGAVCTLLALLRGEPRRALQAIVLLANVCVALFFGLPFLRGTPAPSMPIGEKAFLTLAPGAERVGRQAIVLAYPAPYSAVARRGKVSGQRDSRGVVTNLRPADSTAKVKPGEVRLQLEAVDGRWTVRREEDHLRFLPDQQWKLGAYLEISVGPTGWAVPVGIANKELRPLDSPR